MVAGYGGHPRHAYNLHLAYRPPGLLVPDIPVEETDEIRAVAASHGIELVLLVTPTTPRDRMERIARTSAGFVYLVSVTGAWFSADYGWHLPPKG